MFLLRAMQKAKYFFLRYEKKYKFFREVLAKDALNAGLHFQFARACLAMGNTRLAVAELKTALMLGEEKSIVLPYLAQAQSLCPSVLDMDHNTYYRFETLRREVMAIPELEENFSVLDVGGGEGVFAQFLPTDNYCLVEPNVNGISGVDLPFADQSFDVVVACHVLEHIPKEQREKFLTQLCTKAKKAVILLNPFYVEGLDEKKRLQFHVELTGAWWAKEHLEFSLPTLDEVRAFAKKQGVGCASKPNGSLALSFASVYVDHFACQARQHKALSQVNRFMNENFTDIAVSEDYPNAYVVCLMLPFQEQ